MGKVKFYQNITTNEIVLKEDAENYVLDRLGMVITPKGENGEMTLEQIENIDSTVEWFFSGNWIEDEKDMEEM